MRAKTALQQYNAFIGERNVFLEKVWANFLQRYVSKYKIIQMGLGYYFLTLPISYIAYHF